MLPISWRAIVVAFKQGYSADPKAGLLYGKSGSVLSVKKYPGQSYPTVRLHISGLPRSAYSVPAHKMMAYAIWGHKSLIRGTNVRHGRGGVESIKASNLRLGSYSENELDKPASVRSASAKAARAAQGRTPKNALLSTKQAQKIRAALRLSMTPKGRVRRGIVRDLAERYGVSRSTISLIGKEKSWKESTS